MRCAAGEGRAALPARRKLAKIDLALQLSLAAAFNRKARCALDGDV